MKKRKILFVLNAVGGVDVYARLLISIINTNLFEIVIVYGKQNKNNSPYIDKYGKRLKTYLIPLIRNPNPLYDFISVYQLIKIIKKEKPTIIHSHSAKAGAISRIAGKICSIDVLYTPHAFSYLSTKNKLLSFTYKTIEKLLKYCNSYILATSHSEASRAIKDIGYNSKKVYVWENSIYPINFKDIPINPNLPEKYICTIGRPSYQKNLEDLINIFETVIISQPNLKLIIMGVGFYSPKESFLRKLIKEKKLENNVSLFEWADRKNVFQLINQAQLYVSTSRYEGLPYSIIECLALRKACVVSNCDGNIDLIKNEINGFVIPQEKLLEEMPIKIIEILTNKDLCENFENNAQLLFDQKYNIEKNIFLIENVYSNMVKK